MTCRVCFAQYDTNPDKHPGAGTCWHCDESCHKEQRICRDCRDSGVCPECGQLEEVNLTVGGDRPVRGWDYV